MLGEIHFSKRNVTSLRMQSTSEPFISRGVKNVIDALAPNKRPSGAAHFPWKEGWSGDNARVKGPSFGKLSPRKVLRDWFKELIGPEDAASQRIDDCTIVDNLPWRKPTDPLLSIACFAAVNWKCDVLTYCRIQVLVVEGGDLLDFYLRTKPCMTAQYYRLELDPTIPCPLFAEPQPHIHSVPDGPPRFGFRSNEREYLPLSFLEFVILNHAHDLWLSWVVRVAQKRKFSLPVTSLDKHYKDGKIWGELRKFESHLKDLKLILLSEKCRAVQNAPSLSPDLLRLNYCM